MRTLDAPFALLLARLPALPAGEARAGACAVLASAAVAGLHGGGGGEGRFTLRSLVAYIHGEDGKQDEERGAARAALFAALGRATIAPDDAAPLRLCGALVALLDDAELGSFVFNPLLLFVRAKR